MKRIIITILSAILLLGFAPEADSSVLNSYFLTQQIEKEIISALKDNYNGKVEAKVLSLPYKSIDVPDGDVDVKTEISNLGKTSIVKVSIFLNGVKFKNFGVRAQIKIHDKVWVAKDWVKRGNTLTNLTRKEMEITAGLGKLPSKNFSPALYRARTNIKPGEIITLNDIERIPTIVKNSPVSLIFKTSSVSVSIPGIAVTAGKTGDFIKVKSEKYKKNYVGKIIGANMVLINI